MQPETSVVFNLWKTCHSCIVGIGPFIGTFHTMYYFWLLCHAQCNNTIKVDD